MKQPESFEELKNIDLSQFYKGIDISHYQGNLAQSFWDEAKKIGISFVYLKASEGSHNKDACALHNAEVAIANGMQIGYYHFAHTDIDAVMQASNFKEAIQLLPPSGYLSGRQLPAVLDLEENILTKTDCLNWVNTFIDKFNSEVMIYSRANFIASNLPSKYSFNGKFWASRYINDASVVKPPAGNQTGSWNEWYCWQFTSTGKILNKDYDFDLMRK